MFGFGKKKAPAIHIVMDKDAHLLAKCQLLGDVGDEDLEMTVVDGSAEDVMNAGIIQIIPAEAKEPVLMACAVSRRLNQVTVEPLRKLGSAVRRNFRMPMTFYSFVYYLPRGGRAALRSIDLSSGGIAFFSSAVLEVGEHCQVVIPITAESPLIVTCEILRSSPGEEKGFFRYAAKFYDMIEDEESLIREAVFSVQLETVRISRQRSRQEAAGRQKRG